MTTTQIRRIHVALEQAKGEIEPTARLLGITTVQLNEIIKAYPELQSYTDGATPPSAVELISRPPMLPAVVDEASILAGYKAADAQLKNGLSAIGVKPGVLQQVLAFHQFGRIHFKDTRHLIGGGIIKLYSDLFVEREELLVEIKDAITKTNMDRERFLREDLDKVNKAIISVYDRCLEAWRIQTKIDAAKEAARAASRSSSLKTPPGFAPLKMVVNGNVEIKEQPAPVPAPAQIA